jgi:hypothetical protein
MKITSEEKTAPEEIKTGGGNLAESTSRGGWGLLLRPFRTSKPAVSRCHECILNIIDVRNVSMKIGRFTLTDLAPGRFFCDQPVGDQHGGCGFPYLSR